MACCRCCSSLELSVVSCCTECGSTAQTTRPSTLGPAPLQTINLRVQNVAGDVIAEISTEYATSTAELKALVTQQIFLEYGKVVELAHGGQCLFNTASLWESGLSDGDELVASCARMIAGEFAEYRMKCCFECGYVETRRVHFCEEELSMEVTLGEIGPPGETRKFEYTLGEAQEMSEHMDIPIDLVELGLDSCSAQVNYQGTLSISKHDHTKQRLVVQSLGIHVLDMSHLRPLMKDMLELELDLFHSKIVHCVRRSANARWTASSSRGWWAKGAVKQVSSVISRARRRLPNDEYEEYEQEYDEALKWCRGDCIRREIQLGERTHGKLHQAKNPFNRDAMLQKRLRRRTCKLRTLTRNARMQFHILP